MKHLLVSSLAVFAWSVSAAGLSVLRPQVGATVSVLSDLQKSFITNSIVVRRAIVDDFELRKAALLSAGSRPRWLELAWSPGEGCPTNAEYEVRVFKLPENREVLVRTTCKTSKYIANLEIGADYRWTVSTVSAVGERLTGEGWFRTEDLAPRLLFFGKVPNARDLGGRRGLNGRRVRQGMIFRSAALNNNAKKPKKKGEKSSPCRPKLTLDEVSSIQKDFNIRTDVDLRADWECYGMTGSPLGESVRWVHVPSSSYGDMAGDYGKKAFARVFRAFLDEKNYPIVFHCLAGADRTGAVAYILGALLGCSDDDLLLDWEVTAFFDPNPVFAHRRFDLLVKAFEKMPGETTVERVENYVKSAGFTDEDIRRFRSLLLEDVQL